MRALFLLAPLVAAFPTHHKDANDANSIPELNVAQWAEVQSGFGGLREAGEWAWSKAHELVGDAPEYLDRIVNDNNDGDETQETIWQRLKADPHSFSRLTGLIEVSCSFRMNPRERVHHHHHYFRHHAFGLTSTLCHVTPTLFDLKRSLIISVRRWQAQGDPR